MLIAIFLCFFFLILLISVLTVVENMTVSRYFGNHMIYIALV